MSGFELPARKWHPYPQLKAHSLACDPRIDPVPGANRRRVLPQVRKGHSPNSSPTSMSAPHHQCIAHGVQELPVTTNGLSNAAFAECCIVASICWISKPQDVRYSVRITMSVTTDHTLREAGPVGARSHRQTALNFVDDLTPSWALKAQPFLKLPVESYESPCSGETMVNCRG